METNKEALLAAEKKLENLDILTNNAILAQIEDHRKPNLLEYVLHKMKRFTQSYSKKKFTSRLLERDKIDKIMENLLKNPNYEEETYEILKKRAQEMEEEDLQQQLEGKKEALNASIGNKLTRVLNSAVIKLRRKSKKNLLLDESYRPISLLSIFYKLASCCITKSIKPVFELLIEKQQKAYITSNNMKLKLKLRLN